MTVDQYIIEVFNHKLLELGYHVEKKTEYLGLSVNGVLDIATGVNRHGDHHPSVLHLLTLTSSDYFPASIQEFVTGVGDDLKQQAEAAADDYLATVLPAIVAGLTEGPVSGCDFVDARGALWHPKPGQLLVRGTWEDTPDGNTILAALQEALQTGLPDQSLNWVKVFLVRLADQEPVVECLLNNKTWEAPCAALRDLVATWPAADDYRSQKLFVVLRQCLVLEE